MRIYDPLEKIATILRIDHIVERGVRNGWNYVKYASGYIDAWAFTSIAASENTKIIALPTAMEDTSYNIIVTPHENGSIVSRFWIGNLSGNNAKTVWQFSLSLLRTANYSAKFHLQLHGKYKQN